MNTVSIECIQSYLFGFRVTSWAMEQPDKWFKVILDITLLPSKNIFSRDVVMPFLKKLSVIRLKDRNNNNCLIFWKHTLMPMNWTRNFYLFVYWNAYGRTGLHFHVWTTASISKNPNTMAVKRTVQHKFEFLLYTQWLDIEHLEIHMRCSCEKTRTKQLRSKHSML